MKALIATIAVALVAAAPAFGADLPPNTLLPYGPTVDVSRGQAAALAYWGRAPDCPDGVEATMFEDPDPKVGARGAQCHIWIDQSMFQGQVALYGRDAAATDLCDEVIHEFGHLLGYDHSDVATEGDPLDMMNGNIGHRAPQCEDVPPAAPDAAPATKHHHHRHRVAHGVRRVR